MSHQLLRLSRSVPLSTLKQGSRLSLRSYIPKTNVFVQPKWRDDGHVSFQQAITSPVGSFYGQMTIESKKKEDEKKHEEISILLQEQHQSSASSSSESRNLIFDDGSILPDLEKWSLSTNDGLNKFEYHDGTAHVVGEHLMKEDKVDDTDAETDSSSIVTIVTPEKVDLDCELYEGGSIHIDSKVEGDVRLVTTNGNILVKKLRGHKIELETHGDDTIIYASDLLEAQGLTVSPHNGSRFRAKKIHGHSVDITTTPMVGNHNNNQNQKMDEEDEGSLIDVSSIYIAGDGGAQIRVAGPSPDDANTNVQNRAVRIKSQHGPVQVEAVGLPQPTGTNDMVDGETYPLVELNSVNGSCEVSIRDTKATSEQDWTSCQVHFETISPDSVSLITSNSGSIKLSLDRKVESDLRFLSRSSSSDDTSTKSLEHYGELLAMEEEIDPQRHLVDIVENTLLKHDDHAESDPSRIQINTESFTTTTRYHSNDIEYVEGHAENKSHEPDSRFDRKMQQGAGGKIRLEGAATQALQNFSSPQQKHGGDGADNNTIPRGLVVVASSANIIMETLSWIGAIARRYGLNEERSGKDLGRTATRRGRPIAVVPPAHTPKRE